MKKSLKMISVVLTVALLLTVFATPVAARQRGDRGESRGGGRQNAREIQYLDAEVRLINGQPMIVIEVKDRDVYIPFELTEKILVNDQIIPIAIERGTVVVPTENGYLTVPFEDFDVIITNGQVMLATDANPLIIIPVLVIGAGSLLGGLAGIGTGAAAVAGLKVAGFTVGTATAKLMVGAGGVSGAIVGGAAAANHVVR